MKNKSTKHNNYPFEQAILQGRSIADVYLEVMEKSAHSRIQQLSQSSEFHQGIARKFNQVFEDDTLDVMNEYANQCYEELKHLDCADDVDILPDEESKLSGATGFIKGDSNIATDSPYSGRRSYGSAEAGLGEKASNPSSVTSPVSLPIPALTPDSYPESIEVEPDQLELIPEQENLRLTADNSSLIIPHDERINDLGAEFIKEKPKSFILRIWEILWQKQTKYPRKLKIKI